MAEWLGTGLQNRLLQFNSGRRLHRRVLRPARAVRGARFLLSSSNFTGAGPFIGLLPHAVGNIGSGVRARRWRLSAGRADIETDDFRKESYPHGG